MGTLACGMLVLPVPAEAAAGGILYFMDTCVVLNLAYDLANDDELRGGLQLWQSMRKGMYTLVRLLLSYVSTLPKERLYGRRLQYSIRRLLQWGLMVRLPP